MIHPDQFLLADALSWLLRGGELSRGFLLVGRCHLLGLIELNFILADYRRCLQLLLDRWRDGVDLVQGAVLHVVAC